MTSFAGFSFPGEEVEIYGPGRTQKSQILPPPWLWSHRPGAREEAGKVAWGDMLGRGLEGGWEEGARPFHENC